MRHCVLWSISICLLIGACVPPSETDGLDIVIDLSDDTHKLLVAAKDEGDYQTLSRYLTSENATLRYLAVEAFSSLTSTDTTTTRLIQILKMDPSEDVRLMAAYALGQQKDTAIPQELIQAFRSQDTATYNSPVRGAILEAIGKCADVETLRLIASVSTYTNADDHLLLGQARAIYRFARRNIYDSNGTQVMINRLLDTTVPDATRVIAAQYLNRYPDLDLGSHAGRLSQMLSTERNVHVKMALAAAVTRGASPEAQPVVLNLLSQDSDYRVRCNILRQLGSYPYQVYRDVVISLLNDPNQHVFDLASSLLQQFAPRQEYASFLELARTTDNDDRKAQLYAIALNALPSRFINTRKIISDEMTAGLASVSKESVKAKYINALALDPVNLPTIISEGFKSSSNLIRTTAINSIPSLLNNSRTLEIYRRPSALTGFREAIVSELMTLLESGDSGTVAVISSIIKDETCGLKNTVGLNLRLRSALRKLSLPQDYEAKKEGQEALGYLEDTTYAGPELVYNHPIDWTLLTGLSDSSRAFIITTKGQIELKLYKNHAPGSVANFVSLAQSNFYDGKSIHRVVPNFVIQGGCPRGDGYGSLDYTIRSELGPKYYDDDGYVGMASAGPNTEGTQWFITHSPTPHLDGNYTIFAKVISGMDVVHNIYQGDLIQDVRILKY